MIKFRTKILFLLLAIISPLSLQADIYKYVDKKGNVHYSTTPPNASAKPAELPQIQKKDFIPKEVKETTCIKHGGVNCQAGADYDGSVICTDGFRDATARYRFSCMEASLSITEPARRSGNGAFSLIIRNSSSTKALNPNVVFISNEGNSYPLESTGDIEPYGIGEFTLILPDEERENEQDTLPTTQFKVTCSNCK